MNIIGICITILLISIILFFSRRWAALAIIAGVLYLTQGQILYILGFNIYGVRFIELAGLIRILFRKEVTIKNINNIDKAFVVFNTIYVSVYLTRCIFDVSSRNLITYQIGVFVDSMIVYFVFRGLIYTNDALNIFLKDVVFLLIPFTIFMIVEGVIGENIFSYMGGVPIIPVLREGHYRCQASFRHAILAGSVGATMLPLFLYLTFLNSRFTTGVFGIILCIIIVYCSHSSGPIVALCIGIMVWISWSLRKRMKVIRWGIVGLLLSLHIIMKSPVWFLPARMSDIIGGDGWHRANLINKWINSIGEWWLFGMSWDKTANWAATTMIWGAVDATNEYIIVAINGGGISLTLFIILLVKCYKNLGIKLEEARQNCIKQNELLYWGVGASLTSHIVNLMSVSYWDQSYVIWYMLLAIISGITGDSSIEDSKSINEDFHLQLEAR